MNGLPPPLLIMPGQAESTPPAITLLGDSDTSADRDLAASFGRALAAARAARGIDDHLTLNTELGGDRPPEDARKAWVPHVFCFETLDRPLLIWEQCDRDGIEEKLGASLADVDRWAKRPDLLLKLVGLAAANGQFVEVYSHQPHLSFRWVLEHQEESAEILSEGVVKIEHVSLHVDPAEEEAVVDLLVEALGLVEIPRPTQITVPGRWLQAGHSRIHLNSRAGDERESDFPGPRPNHVCFGVRDVDAAERALEAAGIPTRRAGSLEQQLWFRLSGMSIELQPLAPQAALQIPARRAG